MGHPSSATLRISLAHLSLPVCRMGRTSTLVLGLLLIVFFCEPRVGEAPFTRTPSATPVAAAPAKGAQDVAAASIRVEHELVHAPVVISAATPVRSRLATAVRHSRMQKRHETEQGPPTVASRARRMFFGDGTHRPEPFPRPTRD